jgi:hypothetical protein
MAVVAMRKDWPPTAGRKHFPALHFSQYSRGTSMGKPIALFFACAALVIIAGSFVAPTTLAARKDNCSPAYGIDPCATSAISAKN